MPDGRRPGRIHTCGGANLAPNGLPPATLPEPIKRACDKDLAGSLARAMWLSGASACERSETRGPQGFQGPSAGGRVSCFTI